MFEGFRGLFGKPAGGATGIYKIIDIVKNPFQTFSNAFKIVKIIIVGLIVLVLYKKFG